MDDKEAAICDSDIAAEKQKAENELNGNGRVVLRKSGTEPVIRVMVEAENEKQCDDICTALIDKIAAKGY